jgi:O-antigen/teichoic acid export membrane protein
LKRIVKSAFFITLGGALPLLSSVVLLFPYTANLTTAHYGALAIYISFALLVQIIMNYAIDSYLSVHYYDHHEDKAQLKTFLASISGTLLCLGAIFIFLFSVFGYLLFPLIFKDTGISFFPYGFMSVLTGFFNAWFRTYVNIQVFGDKPVKYFLFGLFNFVVTVGISTWLVYDYQFTLIGPMWGRLLSGVLIFLLTFAYGIKEFGIRFNFKLFPQIKTYATPIVIFSILTWVLGYINNYILNAMATPGDVGVYDFALKCTLVIEYAGLGITGAMNPRIYQLWKKSGIATSTAEDNRFYHVYSALNIIIIALNILLLPFVIKLFVQNEEYYASIQFLPMLCAAFVFKGLYSMYINPIMYFKKTKVLPKILLISAIVQIVSGIILVYYWGITGAVWSYFIVRPIQIFLLKWEAEKIFDFNFNGFKLIWVPLIYVTAVMLLWELNMQELFRSIMQLAVASILIFIAYRKELKNLKGLFAK